METLILRNMCNNYARFIRSTHTHFRQLSQVSNQKRCCVLSSHSHRWYSVNRPPKPPGGFGTEEAPFVFRGGKPQHRKDIDKALKNIRKGVEKQDAEASRPWIKLGVLLATGLGFVGVYWYMKNMIRGKEIDLVKSSTKTADPALIGGDWELTDHFGKTVTNKDFQGNWCVVYFGFTHCPDICPDEIEKIIEVTEILERDKNMPKIIPLFVTVDPDRDTPEIMREYLEEFSPKLIGLTGSWEQLNVILKEFKVYFSQGPKDEDGDYIVDHSIITFLMNPDSKYVAHFARSKTNIDIADAVKKQVTIYNKSH